MNEQKDASEYTDVIVREDSFYYIVLASGKEIKFNSDLPVEQFYKFLVGNGNQWDEEKFKQFTKTYFINLKKEK